jgi:hypothetical protein
MLLGWEVSDCWSAGGVGVVNDTLMLVGLQIVPLEDADDREVEELGHRLRSDLLTAPVTHVGSVSAGAAPEGSKGLEVLALGQFVVGLVRSVPGLRKVVGVLRDFVAGQPVRSIKITLDGDVLEVTAVSGEDQRRLIDAWIARHTQVAQ